MAATVSGGTGMTGVRVIGMAEEDVGRPSILDEFSVDATTVISDIV